MDISTIVSQSPDAISKGIAGRARERRLELNLTQKAFAKRAGIGYDAWRRFENTGEITLHNLILCAIVLDDTQQLTALFIRRSYQSMDDLLKLKESAKRKRGSRKE